MATHPHDDATEEELAASRADKAARQAATAERRNQANDARQVAIAALAAGGPQFDSARMAHMLTKCLPSPAGYLIFELGEDQRVALSGRTMRRLRDLKRTDLTATVDKQGIHILGSSTKLRMRLDQMPFLHALTRSRKPWPEDVHYVAFPAAEVAA